MKILHVISSSGMYGAESVILNLLRQLTRSGHSCELAVFAHAGQPRPQLYENALKEGITSHWIPCSGQIDRGAIRLIRNLAVSRAIDLVHAHGYKADIYCWLALRGHEVALVSTCHNWIDSDIFVTLYGKADRFVLRNYHRVVAVSSEVRERLLKSGVSSERIRIVRNGIDLEPYADASQPSRKALVAESATVGIIGRLSAEKGFDIFLRATPCVLAEFPGSRFVVVGDGPDREKLESLIDELNIREHVTMAGRRDDMPAVYASLDVMVSASRLEGLPMVLLEGMASGRPIVATRVGEVPALISDGQTGLLVPPEDPDALARAISALLADAELRTRLGLSARRLVEEQYSSRRMTEDYLRVYEEALGQAAGRSDGFADRGGQDR